MSRRRVVVAALAPTTDDDPALQVSRTHLQRGDEVVHLGSGLDPDAVAGSVVAEDAVHVVLVGADPAALERTRTALAALDASDVTVDAG
ncbi:hypothetical protein [Aeromicrobium sp. CTD01-1L150]|uniref:hypothetical protein n=1 Tax=Aeromicrobium sp. CTD01-1L150 TaxID=3341830 RepID=UPI0035C22B27